MSPHKQSEPDSVLDLSDLKYMRETLDKRVEGSKLPQGLCTQRLEVEYIPLEWYRPESAASEKVVLYIHGGGYVMGSIKSHSHFVAELAQVSGFNFLSLEYRLAPENPFPCALYDVLTIYKYLLAEGFRAENIAIAGDSAGAGLALSCLISLREQQYPQPAFALLLSAWLDLTLSGESLLGNAERDPLIDRRAMAAIVTRYLCGESTESASPLFANLDGLSPLFLQVGTYEGLLDDSVRLTERAKQFDIDITLDRWDKMNHGWQFLFQALPEGRLAIERIGEYMRESWA